MMRFGKITIESTRQALPLCAAFTTDRLTPLKARYVIIQGLATNAGNWYLGSAQVSPTNYGWAGVALDTLTLPDMEERCHDLSQLYITVDNIGEGVTFFFE